MARITPEEALSRLRPQGLRKAKGGGALLSLAAEIGDAAPLYVFKDADGNAIITTSDGDLPSARAAAGVKSDEYCMANGITPSSFWRASKTTAMAQVDKIHLNKDGYILMAKMFYDKIKQLNYI